MEKRLKYIIVLGLVFLSQVCYGRGQDGGYISYRYLGNDLYYIELHIFSISSNAGSALLTYEISDSCQFSGSWVNPMFHLETISHPNRCPIVETPLSSGASRTYDHFEHVFADTVGLPGPCTYLVSFRNRGVGDNGGATYWGGVVNCFLSTYINTSLGTNNSIIFNPLERYRFIDNQIVDIDLGGTDPDGDSLAYELIPAVNTDSTFVPFSGAFTPDSMVPSTEPIEFNPFTGRLRIVLKNEISRDGIVVLNAKEYRSGQLINVTKRYVLIDVERESSQTQAPKLINWEGDAVYACPNDTFTVQITSYPTGAPNGLKTIVDTVHVPPNMIIEFDSSTTPSNFTYPVVRATFMPDSSMISGTPHTLVLSIRGDTCAIGTNSESLYYYDFYATWCDSSALVWPGDVNNDFVVDVFDVLHLGIAYGSTGYSRANASSSWVGQYAKNWNLLFQNSWDYKFADCNGDGEVDLVDQDVISQNLGLTHSKAQNSKQGRTSDPPIYLENSQDSLNANGLNTITIKAGDIITPFHDLYGLAFTLIFDPTLVNTSSLSFGFDNSQIGHIYVIDTSQIGTGNISIGMSKTNGSISTNIGEVASLSFQLMENVDSSDIVQFDFSNIKALSFDERELQYYASANSWPVIPKKDQITDTTFIGSNVEFARLFKLYPNPTTGEITIQFGQTLSGNLTVTNVLGEEIKALEFSNIQQLSLTINSEPGVYFITVQTAKGLATRKVLVN